MFEDNSGNGHKDNAASQDEEDGRDHPDLCLAHLFFLENGQNKGKKKSMLLELYSLHYEWQMDHADIICISISVICELIK